MGIIEKYIISTNLIDLKLRFLLKLKVDKQNFCQFYIN